MKKSNIIVAGCEGQLGKEFLSYLKTYENDLLKKNIFPVASTFFVRGLTKSDLDITDREAVCNLGKTLTKNDIIINCAAYNNVTKAQTDRIAAYKANALGPKYLAETCIASGAKLVHFSTDFVFSNVRNGKDVFETPLFAYSESDSVNPINYYGVSKYQGEKFAQINPNSLIIRTSWLYGQQGNNFIRKVIEAYNNNDEIFMADQKGTPTWTFDLVQQTLKLLEFGACGLYHCANHGRTGRVFFARTILKELGLSDKISMGVICETVKRPSMSVLDNCLLEMEGLDIMNDWEESLIRYLKQNKEYYLQLIK